MTGVDWKLSALCAQTDPEAFFPEKGGSTRAAKKICGGCPVRAECLADALLRKEEYGVWGGLSERERRRLHGGPVAEPEVRGTGGPARTKPILLLTAEEYERASRKFRQRGECRLWTGKLNHGRYPRVQLTRSAVRVDVRVQDVLWVYARGGAQPAGRVQATCGNPACIAAGHLVDTGATVEVAA